MERPGVIRRVCCGIAFAYFVAVLPVHAQTADTTKPSAPSGLVATPASDTRINLTWNSSTDNVGVTGYLLERCTGTSCTTWAQIATTPTPNYSDSGLLGVTTYRYRVRATDAANNLSNYSGAITTKTLDGVAPSAPTLTATVNSAVKITVNWTAATDNVKVTGYYVDRCIGAGCSNFAQIASTTTALTYGNTGLAPLTTYQYRIRAFDAAGNQTASNVVSVTTSADTTKPSAPAGFTATASSASQVNLTWTASTDNVAVANYLIERCASVTCSTYTQIGISVTPSYSDNTTAGSTTYRYRVRATDAANNLSNYSSVVNVTTPAPADITPPTVPSNLVATAISPSQVDLSWSPSTDDVAVSQYSIEQCQGSGCTNFTQVATTTTTSYSALSLNDGTNYSYRVRASDSANNLSNYSVTASAITPVSTIPGMPIYFTVTAVSNVQVNLSWTVSSNDPRIVGYVIERCQGNAPDCASFVQVGMTSGTAYSDIGLTPSTTYSYRARATDGANHYSTYTAILAAKTPYAGGPVTYTYSYDALGRLTQASGSDGSVITYTYDANGNMTSLSRQ